MILFFGCLMFKMVIMVLMSFNLFLFGVLVVVFIIGNGVIFVDLYRKYDDKRKI